MQGLTDWMAVATVMREVARGLAYMHQSGRIHRDLKAANILVAPDGKVALAGESVSIWFGKVPKRPRCRRGRVLRRAIVGPSSLFRALLGARLQLCVTQG